MALNRDQRIRILALVCVIILALLFFLPKITWQTAEDIKDSLQENQKTITEVIEVQENVEESVDEVTVTQEFPASGAIAKAGSLANQSSQALKDEAVQFGLLPLFSSEVEAYEQIRDRLFASDELASALRATYKEGVVIIPDRKWKILAGMVYVNVDTTDEEIIVFLALSTPKAKAQWVAFKALKAEATQFGLQLFPSDIEEYKQIRDRLFANDELASVFIAASDADIFVDLDRRFKIANKYININVDATDEEIIEFLLGKQSQ